MDLTFKTSHGKFKYRVSGVFIRNGKLLVMRDCFTPHFVLPGGRVKLHETAEDAMLREIREEVGVSARIARPLWLDQSFYTVAETGQRYHELCLYFLIDFSETELMQRGNRFHVTEGKRENRFTWLPFSALKKVRLYPPFLKKEIYRLPDSLTLRIDRP